MTVEKILAINKEARHAYTVLDTIKTGIKLTGPEVKSVKKGSINLKGSFATIQSNGHIMLLGAHIAPYKPAAGAQIGYDATRGRILLMKAKEKNMLIGKLHEKRFSLVPLSVYVSGGLIKVELGLVLGKKKYEKREQIKKRDMERDLGRRLKH